jgi:ubiquinone/menaquinone biosynthesis C-methylase UbiE
MELTRRNLRRLRIKTARPIYPVDEKLVKAAKSTDKKSNQGIYAPIQNPATHLIYRYLSEFMVSVLEFRGTKPISEIRLLDWGGGKGYVAYFLDKKGIKTTLYETDKFPHKVIWKKFSLNVKTSAGKTLPFKDGYFDAIVGFGVLEHVPYDYEALKELNRILKDDGLFFCFNLPNKTGYVHKVAWLRGARYHDRLYTRKEAKELLKRSGFNIIGKPWFRQLLPKTHFFYPKPHLFEKLDLFATNYTPLCYLAASIEFVARKQHTYISIH